jgi:formate hydrogenlyase subunit 3/multisubunit Na+/H+ antiporter MnhD subunit
MDTTLLILAWLAPLLAAIPALGRSGRFWPAAGALPALAAALLVPPGATVEVPWLLLGAQLGLDETSRVFLLFSSFLWLIAGAQAALQMGDDPHGGRFRLFFLLAMGGNFGLVVGQDLVSFYLGFALMGLAAYGLVVHDGTETVRRAGRIYLVMTLIAELALFAGLLLLYQRTGDLTPSARVIVGAGGAELALLSLAFAIKAGLIGVHVWLPLAHPAAPVPASAVLSGTMIKAALVGWLRFLPLGEAAIPELGVVLLVAGALTALLAPALGLVQRDPKVVLAYSSVGKMGVMTGALGIAVADPAVAPALVPALAFYAAHHGLSKGALFLGVGVVKKLGAPWTIALLVLPALALVGAPLTSGALAKDLLKGALEPGPAAWVQLYALVLLVSTLGATLLMGRFVYLVHQLGGAAHGGSAWMALPWIGLLAVVLVLPFAHGGLSLSLTDAWPVALGATAVAAVWLARPARLAAWVGTVPPGDLLEPLLRLWGRLGSLAPIRAVSASYGRLPGVRT